MCPYNSNRIEGSRLTHDQTRYIFETNTIGVENEVLNVDDVIETANHFRCIDMMIDNVKATLTEKLIKGLHLILKNGTSDSRKDWFAVGAVQRTAANSALVIVTKGKIDLASQPDSAFKSGQVMEFQHVDSLFQMNPSAFFPSQLRCGCAENGFGFLIVHIYFESTWGLILMPWCNPVEGIHLNLRVPCLLNLKFRSV